MTRQCLWLSGLVLLASLGGCATPPPPPPQPAPPPVPAPGSSAQDIHKAEEHAYWAGFAAGRRYQQKQDAPPEATAAKPPAPRAPAPATASAPAMLQPAPPAPDGYAISGPAQPVATPLN